MFYSLNNLSTRKTKSWWLFFQTISHTLFTYCLWCWHWTTSNATVHLLHAAFRLKRLNPESASRDPCKSNCWIWPIEDTLKQRRKEDLGHWFSSLSGYIWLSVYFPQLLTLSIQPLRVWVIGLFSRLLRPNGTYNVTSRVPYPPCWFPFVNSSFIKFFEFDHPFSWYSTYIILDDIGTNICVTWQIIF